MTKSRIIAKVICASLILRFTFHLIWVSMTAADVHGICGLTFRDQQNRIITSDQEIIGNQISQKKRERGGKCRYVSSSHKFVECGFLQLVGGWGTLSTVPLHSPCSSELPCAAEPWIRSVAPTLNRHWDPLELKGKNRVSHKLSVSTWTAEASKWERV